MVSSKVVEEHLKERYGFKWIGEMMDLSCPISVGERSLVYEPGDWESPSWIGIKSSSRRLETPFGMVHKTYLATNSDGKILLFNYKCFTVEQPETAFINETMEPILENYDYVFYEKNISGGYENIPSIDRRQFSHLIILGKDDEVKGYNFFTNKTFDPEEYNKVIPTYKGEFWSFDDNNIFEYCFVDGKGKVTYVDACNFKKNTIYASKEGEQIVNVEIVDNDYQDVSDFCEKFKHMAAIVTFNTGKKRLLLVNNESGKKKISSPFDNIELSSAYIPEFYFEEGEYEVDPETGEVISDGIYPDYRPGLCFSYQNNGYEGEYLVEPDCKRLIRNRRKIVKDVQV